MSIAKELEKIELEERVRKLRETPHILHPAGGLTENFVYEPVSTARYVFKTVEGKKGFADLKIEYEDEEDYKGAHLYIEVEGSRHYFKQKLPREFLFSMPNVEVIEKWVKGEKQSLTTEQIWRLNGVYYRTFLDFPHKHEFNMCQLFNLESWLVEMLHSIFYLGVKGEFGGGKTVTGETIVQTCRHGYFTGNVSPPFVARAIQDHKVTLMVDELDTMAGTKDSDLNSIFRQGYRRGLKYSRVNPDTLETESYEVFGPKLFTVHSEIEQALQTRTIPIHVRETNRPEYPIINLDKQAFGRYVYTENFLWYMDNILKIKSNEAHLLAQLDTLDTLDLSISDYSIENLDEAIREMLFEKKKALLTEGQVSQVSQVTGRNTELMFLCFALSNLVGVNCNNSIIEAFNQKLTEESERTELGYLGILKQVLTDFWNEKKDNEPYLTEEGFVKISNKEVFDRYVKVLKKEFGEGISPAKFKELLIEFGFTDALNRKKLEVPTPEDSEPKSRLCNVFTERVLRKLGLKEPEEGQEKQTAEKETQVGWALGEKLDMIKQWILTNRDSEGLVDAFDLAEQIRAYGFSEAEVTKVIDILKQDGFIFEVPKIAKFGVR
ncbi:MAG: hypothetical protein ACUVT9_07500 [Candidatus Bathycorpusculaceae bacterium]